MANSDQKARDTLAADETDELISSEKVEGTAVYDRKGEKIGSVHHLMINKYTGQVAYAVISFGGFLGIGAEYHPIPWRLLDYERTGRRLCRRYRPGATREGAALRRESRTGLGGSRLHRTHRRVLDDPTVTHPRSSDPGGSSILPASLSITGSRPLGSNVPSRSTAREGA